MPRPTPKEVAPKKTQQRTEEAPKGRSPVKRLDWYTPQRFEANVTESIDKQGQVLPLYKLVGEANLEPFVWLSIEGQAAREDSKEFSPLRRGLEYIILKNQYNKYPMVELGIVVPEYRESSDPHQQRNLDRPLRELKMGARFSVQWGYSSATINWGAFTVVERQVSFDQGTALLVIKAKMGSKLSATTTSEVFSTTSPEKTLTELAKLAGQRLELDEEFREEVEQEAMNTLEVAPAGDVVGKAIQRVLALRDKDAWIDPQSDTLTISDPFKLDLVGKGIRPLKMTYGFPSSPIESLEIETKRPKRSGTGVRSSKGVTPTGSAIDPKTSKARSIVAGSIIREINGSYVFTHYGFSGVSSDQNAPASQYEFFSAFSQTRDGTTSLRNVITNAEEKWPPSKGFKVSLNENLNRIFPPGGQQDFLHVIVERVFEVSGTLELTEDSLSEVSNLKRNSDAFKEKVKEKWYTQFRLNALVSEVYSGSLVYKIVGAPVNIDGKDYYPVRVYRPKKTDSRNTQASIGDSRNEADSQTSSTTEIATTQTQKEFDAQVERINKRISGDKVKADLLTQYQKSANKDAFLQLKGRNNDEIKALKKFLKNERKLTKMIQGLPNYSILQNVSSRGEVQLSIIGGARSPEEGAQPTQGIQTPANSASADDTPRGSMTPASVSSGVGRPSRRLTLTKLTIKLKAGDWAMRVGRLIELVDVYKSVDNIYFIDAEEHRIDENGFHTVITCKVATSRQKAKNKAISDGRTSERRAKAGDERQEVRDAQRREGARPSSVIIQEGAQLQQLKQAQSLKEAIKQAKRAERTARMQEFDNNTKDLKATAPLSSSIIGVNPINSGL